MHETRSSAHAAILILVATGGALSACGSSSNDDLFGGTPDRSHASGTAGTGHAGVLGAGGVNGAAGSGIGGAGGTAPGGSSGTGAGGAAGSGASGGVGGTAGLAGGGGGGTAGSAGGGSGNAGSASGGTGGSQGLGGSAGGQGMGGEDAGGGSQGLGGSGGSQGLGGAGTGGTSGSSGTGGSGGGSEPPPCVTQASQTVLIGDSYVNWITHSFRADLARLTGESWRMYAAGGSAMASGGIGTMIPAQFENAVRADRDIRVVVMDGGGNDILLPASSWSGGGDCNDRMDSPSLPVCRQIVQASLDRELQLMDRMAEVGVRDVVFFFYPVVPNGTVLGGRYPNAISGWARPQVKEQCDGTFQRTGGRLRCHFVDMVPVFANHPEYFATGDIHPNTSGSAAMAKAVWNTMKAACLAQPASSGCCQP